MSAGAATVVGGIFVEATARGGVGPGELVTGAMDRESVDVVVRAPSWVNVERLRVFVDGELRDTIRVDATTVDPLEPTVRYAGAIEVEVGAAESFVVFVADAEGTMAPMFSRQEPFGVSNPIFMQR